MRIVIPLLLVAMGLGDTTSAASLRGGLKSEPQSDLKSSDPQWLSGPEQGRRVLKKSAYQAVYSTLDRVYDECTVEGERSPIITCTKKKEEAVLTTSDKYGTPKELRVCKTDSSGNRGKCKSYKFSSKYNVDLVLNRVYPGEQWKMVLEAMQKKYGRKACKIVSRKEEPLAMECEGKEDLSARVVATGRKSPFTPHQLEVCNGPRRGGCCALYEFNLEESAYSIIDNALVAKWKKCY